MYITYKESVRVINSLSSLATCSLKYSTLNFTVITAPWHVTEDSFNGLLHQNKQVYASIRSTERWLLLDV